MNKNIKYSLFLALATPLFTSCLQEYLPTNGVTQEQVDEGDKTSLADAVPAYLNTYSENDAYDIGFAGFNIWRDSSTADMPVYDPTYSYYSYVQTCSWLGSNWALQQTIWLRYYALIQKANLVLQAVNPDEYPDDITPAGRAYAFRANAYMELGQWYEYKRTGIAGFDNKAEADGIIGMTVPIVTEKTTEIESRNNPRVPYYKLYRFVLSDLNAAEKCFHATPEPTSKINPGLGVTYGLQARLWLLLGTRFELHPEELSTTLAHEDDQDIPFDKLGISSAKDCFVKAAEYARKAINTGYSPLSETQWFDPKNGFNTVNNAWMWANVITTNDGLASNLVWQSWVSYMAPEAAYGTACTDYNGYRMIDARLFSQISDSDWRKTTWIAPEDVADPNAFNTKYARGLSIGYDTWKGFQAYAGFKFHPANGECTTSTVGNAVSIPMMRVEEMYLIEAEAIGRSAGEAAGRALLESFMNSFRTTDGSYKSTGSGIDGFINDLFTQKRIEFWGEGLILWDYKRLEKAIVRGYPGTNFPEQHRYNSLPNYVAPWSTLCIPVSEQNFNPAVILNPDPSHEGFYDLWTE